MPVVRIPSAVRRPEPVEILVDGETVSAYPGETVATALLAQRRAVFRRSPGAGAPRSAFCMMGVCQECLVRIDGRAALACVERVRAGLRIELR